VLREVVMKTIEVEEEVYKYIAQNTIEIGEPATKILRRLLKLDSPQQAVTSHTAVEHELAEALRDPRFHVNSTVVQKMLHILSVAHEQKKSEFEKVLAIQGRGRKYFALTEAEIEASGNSTQPRKIPGTKYWIMTNTPTLKKKEMLREVLVLLGYSEVAVRAAENTIE
jgi:negative modulator of initiation of replication